MSMTRFGLASLAIIAAASGIAMAIQQHESHPSQDPHSQPATPAQAPAAQPPQRGGDPSGGMGAMLVGGLKSTPGCYGVELAQLQSGKAAIFAWFENKEAVLRWYNHPVHNGAKRMFFPQGSGAAPDYKPLAHVADDAGPIMVVATITMDGEARPGRPPMSQIAIELYEPLPGGLAINGRFAPEGVKVEHMVTNSGNGEPEAGEPKAVEPGRDHGAHDHGDHGGR